MMGRIFNRATWVLSAVMMTQVLACNDPEELGVKITRYCESAYSYMSTEDTNEIVDPEVRTFQMLKNWESTACSTGNGVAAPYIVSKMGCVPNGPKANETCGAAEYCGQWTGVEIELGDPELDQKYDAVTKARAACLKGCEVAFRQWRKVIRYDSEVEIDDRVYRLCAQS